MCAGSTNDARVRVDGLRTALLGFALGSVFCSATLWAVPAKKAPELEELRAFEKRLRASPSKLKYRHNIQRLIADWARVRRAATGQVELEALQGEARAWHLLAHWSGRAQDKARGQALDRQIASKKKQVLRKSRKVLKSKRIERGLKRQWLQSARIKKLFKGVQISLSIDDRVRVRRSEISGTRDGTRRVYFDFYPVAAAKGAAKTVMLKHSEVKRVRIAQFDTNTVRLVLDFVSSSSLPEKIRLLRKKRTTILVGTAPKRRPLARALRDPKRAAQALSDTLAEIVPADGRGRSEKARSSKTHGKKLLLEETHLDAPAGDSEDMGRIVAEMREAYPDIALLADGSSAKSEPLRLPRTNDGGSWLRIRRVVVDPGHGGKDHGAIGRGGLREKDVNLGIAKKLGGYLKRKLGVKVIYTRTHDRFVSLPGRSAIANQKKGDLFVSIHANAFWKRKIHGIETYYLNTTSNRYARRLAARENALARHDKDRGPGPDDPSSGRSALPPGTLGRDLRLVLADLAMRSATAESKRLAGYVQGSLVGSLRRRYSKVRDLGVKHALFYVLLGARMPSILVETGFVTNTMEAKRLRRDAYQAQIATAIGRGIARFIREREALAARSDTGSGRLPSVFKRAIQ